MMTVAFRIAGFLAVVAIGILSLVPGHARPHVLGSGTLEHVVAYFVATSLLCLGFIGSRRAAYPSGDPAAMLRIVALLIAYGGVLEVAQAFIPGRAPGVLDWAADALGAGLGAGTVWLLRRRVLAALR